MFCKLIGNDDKLIKTVYHISDIHIFTAFRNLNASLAFKFFIISYKFYVLFFY